MIRTKFFGYSNVDLFLKEIKNKSKTGKYYTHQSGQLTNYYDSETTKLLGYETPKGYCLIEENRKRVLI